MDHPRGNYRFLQGIAPYSSGVVAMSGFEIVRVSMRQPVPLRLPVFEHITNFLALVNRPLHALCAMELRIPTPLTFSGFTAFNADYQQRLRAHGLLLDDVNPIARTNIAPVGLDLPEPSLYAFSYTRPMTKSSQAPSFIAAGAGDLIDQTDLRAEAIVRPGQTSPAALQEKVSVVMKVMEERLHGLGGTWQDVTSTSLYTTIALEPLIQDAILSPMGPAAVRGANWYYSQPPIQGLRFEMDLRGVGSEQVATI